MSPPGSTVSGVKVKLLRSVSMSRSSSVSASPSGSASAWARADRASQASMARRMSEREGRRTRGRSDGMGRPTDGERWPSAFVAAQQILSSWPANILEVGDLAGPGAAGPG